jgi:glycosyltransferase involved in cell wall biosynthesis
MARDVVILIPVHNDWEAVGLLIVQLDRALAREPRGFRILLIDDGSTLPPPPGLIAANLKHIAAVEVLTLTRNLGHQRAIAVGLCHIRHHVVCDAVVVMDGDGEDDPRDVPRLLAALDQNPACIFAERVRRSESVGFQLGYAAYRIVHRILTGIPVRVGNFSALPIGQVRRLVTVSDLWNHYAASVYKARLPVVRVPTDRARRLAGQSRMNVVSLVVHGLSAMSVFSDRIGVRLLLAATAAGAVAGVLLLALLAARLFTHWAIPAWATAGAIVLCALLPLLLLLILVFVFVILAGRESSTVLPIRDYAHFVEEARPLWTLSP